MKKILFLLALAAQIATAQVVINPYIYATGGSGGGGGGGGSDSIAVIDSVEYYSAAMPSADSTLITTSGSNRILVAIILDDGSGGSTLSSVTYASVPMTEDSTYLAGGSWTMAVYYLVAPAEGENYLAWEYSVTPDEGAVSALSLENVDQSTPWTGRLWEYGGGVTDMNITSGATTDQVIDFFGHYGEHPNVGAGQVFLFENGLNGGTYASCIASSSEEGTGGTVTMTWLSYNNNRIHWGASFQLAP